MTFLSVLALGVALLAALPYLAHRLRRARAEEKPFPPARLAPAAPPKARRRSSLEDKPLFAVRVLQVIALAMLGASPFVSCSRLSLSRGGTSVALAIVLDDSMSMRAVAKDDPTQKTRFLRAKEGARELAASLQDGDSIAIVMAGAPARVALAATTDRELAREALDSATESDRATDLDGALSLARSLIGELPQNDKRVVLLSDLATGVPDAPPIGRGGSPPVWVAMPELRGDAADCAILSADRSASKVRVKIACSPGATAEGREIRVNSAEKTIAHLAAPKSAAFEETLDVPDSAPAELTAVLAGADAIASDDSAFVLVDEGPSSIAIVDDPHDDAVVTGGAPVVEQAIAALNVGLTTHPLPQIPDRQDELAAYAAIVLEDPPGLTPEERDAIARYVDAGGVVLVGLGPHSAEAPLGATFEPFFQRGVTWGATEAKGVRVDSAASLLGESSASLVDLAPRGRSTFAAEDAASCVSNQPSDPPHDARSAIEWTDGAPFLCRIARARGEAWFVTIPFSVDESDLALRPGFLAMLDAFVSEARERVSPRRTESGVPWAFRGAHDVTIDGAAGKVPVTRDEGGMRAAPALVGRYRVSIDGKVEGRVVAPIARELDFRPRAYDEAQATSSLLGGHRSKIDVSWMVALALLALVACELAFRLVSRANENAKA